MVVKQCLRPIVLAAIGSVIVLGSGRAPAAEARSPAQSAGGAIETPAELSGVLDRYCIGCHSQTTPTGGLVLQGIDATRVEENRESWEKVVRRLRTGMMPPAGMPRPDRGVYTSAIAWLEGELDRQAMPYLPAPGLHRLNRTEYANAVRDLLGLEIDPAQYLPSDDSSYGFDNMAGTLGLSSSLVEAYVSAADKISRLAVGEAASPRLVVYRVREDTSQDYHVPGLPLGTRGGLLVDHIFPSDGEYTVTVIPIFGDNMSPQGFGSVEGEKIEALLDGELIDLMDWVGNRRGQGVAVGGAAGEDDGNMRVRFNTTAGPHQVGVTFLETNLAPLPDLNRQFERKTLQTGPTPGYTFFPHVGSIRIEGPFNAVRPEESPSRSRIFVCDPVEGAGERACAERIVTDLAGRAFRRPATPEDVGPLMEFYRRGRSQGDFDRGIQLALARILAAPHFLYRREVEPGQLDPGDTYRIGGFELASRLAYFLWSTGPDEELIELAGSGALSDSNVLEQQVRRMLADPRSRALAVNFAGQWLNLRGLDSHNPLPMVYPDFDDPLRQAMRAEVELLFDSIVREDRSVVELLTADYTFVSERLARHYGIPSVYGSRFRRVELGEDFDSRRGLLGKGAILVTTSKPDRTSPVTRGKWIMTNLLGVSPPEPPPNVPPLPERNDDTRGNAVQLSMRDHMLEHRVRQDCVQCHRLMDPIGFALEGFDATSLWRTEDGGKPIDGQVTLFDNSEVDGPAQLREWLVGYSDQFVHVVAEKLLTYALGRGVEYRDMPVVRDIVRGAEDGDHRFSDLVLGVVRSEPFRTNMKLDDTAGIE